ncbi:MAG TPA: protein kinase [Thermoanaerobaculia bacterium]|nr:protein kinase [Thermoanaerobaculia bacterium]
METAGGAMTMIGRELGPFRLAEQLGEGGMGVVYRAQDSRLGRDVAVKVLPAAFTADAERLARFEREARVLASLSHPNVAAIYEVGEEGGTHYLVMELARGETLAARLARGSIPAGEAIPLAIQIARALEAAHERGIVHRDLKPANVVVDADGQVKVLDFGLARIFEAETPDSATDLAHSPTLTAQRTVAGVILGTAAYMSPEQAKGLAADKRSDIWSFGVVLAEMLSGRPVFSEPTVSETLAGILKGEPDLGALPLDLPPALRRLLVRCLRKDRRERLHDVADARLVLEDLAAGRLAEEPARPGRIRWPLAAALGAGGIAVGAAAALLLAAGWKAGPEAAREAPPPRRWVLEHGDFTVSRPALSPDGNRLAYGHEEQIWVRDLRRLEAAAVPGTEGGAAPFWSPDGEWLGYSFQDAMWKVRVDGTGRTLVTTPAPGVLSGGAAWLPDGRIVFTTGSSALLQVADRGGRASTFLPLGEGEADFHYVSSLPEGKGLLTVVHRGDVFDNVQLVSLAGERREILNLTGQSVSGPVYSRSGHLLVSLWPPWSLWAVPFSLDSLAVTGEPFRVAAGGFHSAVDDAGTLVYASADPGALAEIVVVDRSGEVVARIGEPRRGIHPAPALSPDGETVVVPLTGNLGWDLWAFDLAGGAPRRLTFDDAPATLDPSWSPDGRELFFTAWRSTEDFKIYRLPASGGGRPKPVVEGSGTIDLTRDGRIMVYPSRAPGFNWDLWMRRLDEDGPGTPLLTQPDWELAPALSPDGRFLAYTYQGSVLMRTFPGMDGPWQIGAGTSPRWSADGSRLFYLDAQDLMEVEVTTTPAVRTGAPRRLFRVELLPPLGPDGVSAARFAPTPDGEGFVVVRTLERPPGLVAVQNWIGAIE